MVNGSDNTALRNTSFYLIFFVTLEYESISFRQLMLIPQWLIEELEVSRSSTTLLFPVRMN